MANIHSDQPIWDRAKIENLIKRMKVRKIKFLFVLGVIVPFVFLTAIFYAIGVICALSGNECSSTVSTRFFLALILFSSILVGLILWKRTIARNHFKTDFQDYYHPDLTLKQKHALTSCISELKQSRIALYEVGNYEKFKVIDSMIWIAENWFLVLTENEKDRVGVWLDGRVPLGDLMIRRNAVSESAVAVKGDVSQTKEITAESPSHKEKQLAIQITPNDPDRSWENIKGKNSKYLLPQKNKIENFVNELDKFSLTHFHSIWLEAVITLLNNHSTYLDYIQGSLRLDKQKQFERLFTPIFAKASSNYKTAHQKSPPSEREEIETYEYGIENTRKFLTGKNENIDAWIGKNTPDST